MDKSSDDQLNQVSGSDDKAIEGKRFFACYLLTSLSPRHKGHTYIGFTVNPRRRIRQHNGELRSGAWRTKCKRPWEMVICIYGFPTHVSALQFEWAWQHPRESLAVRKVAESFKSFSGVANKIKLAYSMLNVSKWQSMSITVNYFSTKYKKHSAGCPRLPDSMKVEIHQMDDLPCYGGSAYFSEDKDSDYEVKDDENGIALEQDNKNGDPQQHYEDSLKESSSSVLSACSIRASEDIARRFKERNAEKENIQPSSIEIEDKGSSSTASSEIEIIDIVTPSPEQRATFGKRRAMIAPEIIDLTKSPVFV